MVFYWLVYQDSLKQSSRQVAALTVGNRKLESVDGVNDVASLVRKKAMPVKEVHFSGSFLSQVKMDTTTGVRGHVPNADETLAETLARMQAGETLVDTMKRTGSMKKKANVSKTKKKSKKTRRKRSGSFSSQSATLEEDSDSDTELLDDFPEFKTQASTEDGGPLSTKTSSAYSVVKPEQIDLAAVPTKSAMKKKTLEESLSSTYECSTAHYVHFDTVQIREHVVCLGDNPACSWGPPISLSWEYKTEAQVEDCDDYTLRRDDEKFYRDEDYDYVLSRNQREVMLDALGYSIRAQTEADFEKRRIQQQREDTIHKLKFMKMEERVETLKNAKEAAKRFLFSGRKTQ